MKQWYWRLRYYGLLMAGGGLLGGCGLSDQQWATIWQSVIQSALNTVVGNAISAAIPAAG